ncbi:MAG: arsenic metallochaperone ArsD family protein, partial [Mobilitalea sp.]
LHITVLDGEIIINSRYPKNEEFVKLLNIPMSFIGEQPKVTKATKTKKGGCCCEDGGCC